MSRRFSNPIPSSVLSVCSVVITSAALCGCGSYRVEYVEIPEFYHQASATKIPDEIVLEDGTVVKYRTRNVHTTYGRGKESEPFRSRQETEDGATVIRCLTTDHVLANTLACIRNQEYELLWDELICDDTKLDYDTQGMGFEDFAAFMREYRVDLVRSLTRMVMGLPHAEVDMQFQGPYARAKLRPQVQGDFRFRKVDMVREGVWWKLKHIS